MDASGAAAPASTAVVAPAVPLVAYASFGRRVWAFVLDVLVDLVVLGAISTLTHGAGAALPFTAWFLIHHVGLVTEGGTLGHRIAGLRVVRDDGARVGVVHAALRLVLLACAALPPLGLGVLWMLDEPRRKGWHDLAAGTVVVRELPVAPVPEWSSAPPWRR